MDAISYSYADKQAKRIKKFNENPDSASGILTQPSVIQSGEIVSIPTGRTAIMANTVIDGTINLDGTMFIPSGGSYTANSVESTNAIFSTLKVQGQNVSPFTGFKNLIINGNKQVNQSGLTVTDNAYNYDNHYKVGNNWFMFVDAKSIVSGESYTLSWVGAATAGYYIGTAGALTINAQTFIAIANGETINPTIASNQILWIKFASDASGGTYNKVQFEPGVVATPYEQRLYELEESLVNDLFETSYNRNIAIGSVSNAGAIRIRASLQDASHFEASAFTFKRKKRITPIMTLYSPYQPNAIGMYDETASGTYITSGTFIIHLGENGFSIFDNAFGLSSLHKYSFHYVADARPY